VTFGKTAEFCEKYYRKGQQVLVVGRIQTRTWDDNEGRRRYVTEVICEEAYFADSKRQDGARPDDFGYMPQMPDGSDSPYGMGAQAFNGSRQRTPGGGDNSGGRLPGYAGPAAEGPEDDGRQTQDDDGFMPIESENDLPF
jgi:single stranded DNA-binding protein